MEIGSIYEIDPRLLTRSRLDDREGLCLREVEKYGKKYGTYTASGREAIALALKSLEKNRPDASKRCLLPAYMCDTVFFPFVRAGWELHFYHLDRKLEAAKEELCRQIGQIRPDLLFIHPYYGVDTWKPMRSLLKEWRAQGICIMEDVTQSYYLEEAGREADYIVGSLRKWYPIPDGGFVVSDISLPGEALSEGGEFTEKRLELLTEKWDCLYGTGDAAEKTTRKEDYLRKNREAEEWLDRYDGISPISAEAAGILAAADEAACREKRRANRVYLQEKIKDCKRLCPMLPGGNAEGNTGENTGENAGDNAKENAGDYTGNKAWNPAPAPLYFPVYAKDRDGLQDFLRERGIFAPVLWPVGKENADSLTEEERYIYGHMLALPMDQRYGAEEMQYMAKVLDIYDSDGLPEKPGNREKLENREKPGSREKPENREVIGIRADANDTVAAGHIMRCITIAEQLEKLGKRVVFFTADEYPRPMLEQAGMESVCLHTAWNRMEEETGRLRAELEKAGCHKLLVDSYQATGKYLKDLQHNCRIIYMDDCFGEIYPSDMIINYNAYHVRFPYRETYPVKTKLLLGTAYVPLREEFQNAFSHKETPGLQVLLCSGGGDSCHALAGILSGIFSEAAPGWGQEAASAGKQEAVSAGCGDGRIDRDQVTFHTIVGRFHSDPGELEALAERHPNIKLHYDVKHMAKLMAVCDAAVSAAGTMLFELCAMQVPTVFFVSVDNQRYDSEFFAAEERMLFAGDIRRDREGCLAGMQEQLACLLRDKELRKRMKHRLQEVTDGRGAERIAQEIAAL